MSKATIVAIPISTYEGCKKDLRPGCQTVFKVTVHGYDMFMDEEQVANYMSIKFGAHKVSYAPLQTKAQFQAAVDSINSEIEEERRHYTRSGRYAIYFRYRNVYAWLYHKAVEAGVPTLEANFMNDFFVRIDKSLLKKINSERYKKDRQKAMDEAVAANKKREELETARLSTGSSRPLQLEFQW